MQMIAAHVVGGMCTENTSQGCVSTVKRFMQHKVLAECYMILETPYPGAVFFIHTSIGGALGVIIIVLLGCLAWRNFCSTHKTDNSS